MQPLEVLQGCMEAFAEFETAFEFCLGCHLQLTKKAARTGKRECHGAKFTKQLMPRGEGEAFLVRVDGVKDVMQALQSSWG